MRLLTDKRGSGFIENALWIIVVVLAVAGAGYALANSALKPKMNDITGKVNAVNVPNIQ